MSDLEPRLSAFTSRFAVEVTRPRLGDVRVARHRLSAPCSGMQPIRSKLNTASPLLNLPKRTIILIAALLDPLHRLFLSNACQAIRTTLLSEPRLWSRVMPRDVHPSLVAAYLARSDPLPTHLWYISYRRQIDVVKGSRPPGILALQWKLPVDVGILQTLRRCLLRGVAFRNLSEFAYCGVEDVLRPRSETQEVVLPPLQSEPLVSPRQVVVKLKHGYQRRLDVLRYMLRRGIRDIVAVEADDIAAVLDGQQITTVVHTLAGASYKFRNEDGSNIRLRLMFSSWVDGGADRVNRVQWYSSVTELTVHEGVWESMVEEAVSLPQLLLLRIRFATRFDNRVSELGLTTFTMLEGTSAVKAERLTTIEFSGDWLRSQDSYHKGTSNYGGCYCCGATTISLQDLQTAIVGYHLPALQRVRVLGLECVDVDLPAALASFQTIVPHVEFDCTDSFQHEVARSILMQEYDARSIFNELEGADFQHLETQVEWADSQMYPYSRTLEY
ncbi:hypothetical protein BKA62DRAFT_704307 [Auriculariales sp. MPI-PUGE-AT-0066]|nr:hypothetical protein BKA62DRAFT_704307 [Auriculariales sp. MPI-PUGE-AT-0066]